MSVQQMQQHLIQQINTVKDEDILRMLDEELSYSIQSKENLASLLSEDDYKELASLANGPVGKDAISLTEFNSIMEQWLMK
jgi:hypothetical protein